MSDTGGNLVPGSVARYLPYGEERTSPTTTLSDYGFTGHKENRDLGLTYMNFRYYVPELGRFNKADTIVPEPGRAVGYNRYAYVSNNPLRFSDPTGHRECAMEDMCEAGSDGVYDSPYHPEEYHDLAIFEENDNGGWTENEKEIIMKAIKLLALRMADEIDGMNPIELFRAVFGGPITFRRGGAECEIADPDGCKAWVDNKPIVNVIKGYGVNNPELFIHEMFHILSDVVLPNIPTVALTNARANNPLFPTRLEGFAPAPEYQKNQGSSVKEEFSDMGIGWVHNRWEIDPDTGEITDAGMMRANFMDSNMRGWLCMAINGGC